MDKLPSKAEQQALRSLRFPAFEHINLIGIRSDVANMLSLFGRESIFAQYTRHDISHIDAMLQSLDWIIPIATWNAMTPTDWLIVVLCIYLHDLGLIVTKDEFDRRDASDFGQYKLHIESGARGKEYQSKVMRMGREAAEQFLYQEFVREHHAQRIRAWLSHSPYAHLGVADAIAGQVQSTLTKLDQRILRDLGLVCESHHLDDLDDLAKYKVQTAYGNTPEEICNLQYCAILLRTADLMHVTQDRTPSVAFRLINPSDPKSIEEWRKQIPVVAVRPVPAKDKEGNVKPQEQPSVIGFTAFFTEPEGFFALTSYLAWAREQLRRSSDWAERTNRKEALNYDFPWIDIDESNIEAENFLKNEFEFTLDQGKILDLLTGHTLYNDVSVVIRELVQNSIDAVRVDGFEHQPEAMGTVSISWHSANRCLVIEDTGTGMSQAIIERHFLRAGSSRYQDAEFIKKHRDFFPISRFGIGVLSTFMISDEVEVFTITRAQEEKARKLTLRSLHGKYLIREFDRNSSEIPVGIRGHGTRISLKIRADAEIGSVLDAARNWILFPPCKVNVAEEGQSAVRIGYDSPKAAVTHALNQRGIIVDTQSGEEPKVNVVELPGMVLLWRSRWNGVNTSRSGHSCQQAPLSKKMKTRKNRTPALPPALKGFVLIPPLQGLVAFRCSPSQMQLARARRRRTSPGAPSSLQKNTNECYLASMKCTVNMWEWRWRRYTKIVPTRPLGPSMRQDI